MSTMKKPVAVTGYLTNGHHQNHGAPAATGSGSSGKSSSPSGNSGISHVSIDDERRLTDMYEFGEKLGEGSFGVVWLVTHRASKERYACKVINKDKMQGQKILKLIDREVKILKNVRHKHIIELKEVFETAQKMYLVLELCDGGELSSLLDERGRFSEDDARVVLTQLAGAISYLHRNGKVHRDLKLENILLSKREENVENICVKVTDFGLSIEKDGVGTDSMMDDYCGTPLYMSPEIVENKLYSEKCDIWAMGIIVFKLLTCSSNEQLSELTSCPSGALTERLAEPHWNHISDCVKDCLVGMMRWDPAHRYTADEVLHHPWLEGNTLESSRRLNVLEMMKQFRSTMDHPDSDIDNNDDEGHGQGRKSTADVNTADRKSSVSLEHRLPPSSPGHAKSRAPSSSQRRTSQSSATGVDATGSARPTQKLAHRFSCPSTASNSNSALQRPTQQRSSGSSGTAPSTQSSGHPSNSNHSSSPHKRSSCPSISSPSSQLPPVDRRKFIDRAGTSGAAGTGGNRWTTAAASARSPKPGATNHPPMSRMAPTTAAPSRTGAAIAPRTNRPVSRQKSSPAS